LSRMRIQFNYTVNALGEQRAFCEHRSRTGVRP
jgi:hypothetical protein